MRSRLTYGLAALLAASLALHARLLFVRPSPPPAARPCPPCERAPAACPPATPTCERRLEECQQQGWSLVLRAIAHDRAPAKHAERGGSPEDSGPAAQAEALCDRAKASLRETWQRDRDKIADSLVVSLADTAEQERNVAREVESMREVAGLDERETVELTRAYRERRLARLADAQAALAREPRDIAAVMDAARGLFADEDALLMKVGGSRARDAWRAHQLDGRTVVLAIGAAMADQDWEESIRW